jgi:hypothetical protein
MNATATTEVQQPSLCALYWREYNAKKREEDPNWTAKRRECSARCERKRYIKKMEALGKEIGTSGPGKKGRPRKYD